MKKSISFLLILIVSIGSLTACASKDVEMDFTEFQTMRSFGEVTDQVVEDLKKEDGVKDVVKNEDGSVKIVMDRDKHKKLVDQMKKELDQILEYTETASDFIFIDSIEVDKDYSHVKVYVDKGELEIYKVKNKDQGGENIVDALSLSLGTVISTYKAYAVKGEEVELQFIDKKTDEEIDKIMFPEHFKKMIEEK